MIEALDAMVESKATVSNLPLLLRALHAEEHIGELEPMKDRRSRALRIERLFAGESDLWLQGGTLKSAMIRHTTVCKEMSNPGSREVRQFLELLGVDLKAFLSDRGSDRLLGQIDGLVSRRNAIAHGEFDVSVTYDDVDRYVLAVEEISTEVDASIAQSLKNVCGSPTLPW